MTQKTIFQVSFNPMLWLNLLAVVFVILKLSGALNWHWGWVLLPWFVSLGLWAWGLSIRALGNHVLRKSRRNHPAFQR